MEGGGGEWACECCGEVVGVYRRVRDGGELEKDIVGDMCMDMAQYWGGWERLVFP